MDELYEFMRCKLLDMHAGHRFVIELPYERFAQLYQLVCLMRQIRSITGWMDEVKRDD